MSKVLLVNSNRMQPPVAPLALDYLAAALAEHLFQVDILDLCFSQDIASDIARYFTTADVSSIGVTLRNTDDTYFASRDFFIPALKQVTDCLKAHSAAPIVLGGAGFSIMPEAVLEYCGLDLGIWGEGEYAFPLLCSRLETGQTFTDVPGLIYRDGQGFKRNPPHYIELERMHAPKRGAVHNARYFTEGAMGNLETKRGCPQLCAYCGDPLSKGHKMRLRSPRSVADEMASLLAAGIDHFHFCDSEFNLPEGHARDVCLALIERGLGERVRWYAYLSPAPFSDELAELFCKAGCAGIDFGADSGCDAMLEALGRPFTTADLERTAAICHRHGIVFMYDLLLGGPGETHETLKQTIDFMKRISPDRVGAALGVRVLHGTDLAAGLRRQGPFSANPNLHGATTGNDSLLAPIFYVSSELGEDPQGYLQGLIGEDERFFVGAKADADQNYNYNMNDVLVNAIKRGYRGAFWDILRRL